MAEINNTRLSNREIMELGWAYQKPDYTQHIFIKHFPDVATGHFVVRRLERKCGDECIRDEYPILAGEEAELDKEFSPVEGW